VVFDRVIGQNQHFQFSLARAYVNIQVVNLMRFKACRGYDAQLECGAQTNMAELLSADASREAGNASKKTSLFSAKCRSFIHFYQ
tara:strand:+ start:365 stop:619 length:255 start_codon:yes stop_codon:yes gene_type:complete